MDSSFENAMYVGLTLKEYNECTPYELSVMVNMYKKKEEEELEKIRIQAWLIAKLTTPKVPSYKSVFKQSQVNDNDTKQTEGLDKNKMHIKQIEKHLEEFKRGGLKNGKFRNGRN